MKLYIIESNYLFEDIEAVKKYYPNIPDDVFMTLIALDPTFKQGRNSVGTYGKWILNLYKKNAISEDQFEEVSALLQQFETYKQRLQNRDINAYKTLDDLNDAILAVADDMSLLTKRQQQRWLKKVKYGKVEVAAEDNYEVPYEDSEFIVYIPNTHEASVKLGDGTEWCTAGTNPEWYNNYNQDGYKLYIVKRKSDGTRWQYSDKTDEFRDEDDELTEPYYFREDIATDGLLDYLDSIGFEDAQDYYDDNTEYEEEEQERTIESDGCDCQVLDFDGEVRLRGISVYAGATEIVIPEDIDIIESQVFSQVEVDTVIIENGYDIADYAFYKADVVNVIADSTMTLGNGAFEDCVSLKSVSLYNIKAIHDEVFYGCTSLESVDAPNVTTIGMNAFRECESIKSLSFDKGLYRIGARAFSYCFELKEILIRGNDLTIDEDTFVACPKLETIRFRGSIRYADPDMISQSRNDVVIYVDAWSKNAIVDCVKKMDRRGAVTVIDEETGELLYRYEGAED